MGVSEEGLELYPVLVSIAVVGLASYGLLEITGVNEWWDSILIDRGLK